MWLLSWGQWECLALPVAQPGSHSRPHCQVLVLPELPLCVATGRGCSCPPQGQGIAVSQILAMGNCRNGRVVCWLSCGVSASEVTNCNQEMDWLVASEPCSPRCLLRGQKKKKGDKDRTFFCLSDCVYLYIRPLRVLFSPFFGLCKEVELLEPVPVVGCSVPC